MADITLASTHNVPCPFIVGKSLSAYGCQKSGDPEATYTLLQTGREDGARIGSVADDVF